jgi:hypothetical protein
MSACKADTSCSNCAWSVSRRSWSTSTFFRSAADVGRLLADPAGAFHGAHFLLPGLGLFPFDALVRPAQLIGQGQQPGFIFRLEPGHLDVPLLAHRLDDPGAEIDLDLTGPGGERESRRSGGFSTL